ncbi:MAG: hypothetical protein IJ679_09465, partial [Lachnospiraceae bacterium]|nr:hypothetical protein [Lachnospiraceae bacterium]
MNAKWKSIIEKIKYSATNNVGLKLLSLFCAALLWLLVVNIDDPTQSRNFTATVSVKNEQVLTDAGKYYTLPGGNTVTFRVTARRSVIESLSAGDFKATANMEQLEDEHRIPIEIKAKHLASQLSISSKTHYLIVSVGENTETSFKVQVALEGQPGEGFEVGTASVSPEVVYVEGPADTVSTIHSVSVSCDVAGKTESFSDTAVPKYYDEQGQEVDMTTLSTNAVSVVVNVEMLNIQDVPIAVSTRGEMPSGLELDTITTEPSSIRLKGKPDQLNSLTTLTIPPDVIDLSEITDDFETTIDIQSYLPDGISIVNGESSQVRIQVSVLSEDSREFKVKTSNLTVRYLSPGLIAEFKTKTVKVRIRGMESSLEELDASTVAGSVDASGLSEGEHSVAVSLELDEGLSASTVTTDIVISHVNRPDDIDDESGSEGSSSGNKDSSKASENGNANGTVRQQAGDRVDGGST